MFGVGQNTKGEQNLKSNQRFAKRLQHLKHLIMCSVKPPFLSELEIIREISETKLVRSANCPSLTTKL